MSTRTLGAGRFLRLVAAEHWEYIERINASGVVAVAAVTEDERLLIVEQHRPPVGGPVLELPAGLCGDDPGASGEPLELAACRELLEETGHQVPGGPEGLQLLFTVPSSAGLTSEVVTIFGARRGAEGGRGWGGRRREHRGPRAAGRGGGGVALRPFSRRRARRPEGLHRPRLRARSSLGPERQVAPSRAPRRARLNPRRFFVD